VKVAYLRGTAISKAVKGSQFPASPVLPCCHHLLFPLCPRQSHRFQSVVTTARLEVFSAAPPACLPPSRICGNPLLERAPLYSNRSEPLGHASSAKCVQYSRRLSRRPA